MSVFVTCLSCGKRYRVSEKRSGQVFECQQCKAAVKVPEVEEGNSLGLVNFVPPRKHTVQARKEREKQAKKEERVRKKEKAKITKQQDRKFQKLMAMYLSWNSPFVDSASDYEKLFDPEEKSWRVLGKMLLLNFLFFLFAILFLIGLFGLTGIYH